MGWAESGVRALLISSSKVFGGGYLEHAEAAICERLSGVRRVLFIPHALANRDAYAERARTRFEAMGFRLNPLHAAVDPRAAVEAAEAVFVGGGNTFRVLKALSDLGVLARLRARALAGMPYIGASAGTNVACPTLSTAVHNCGDVSPVPRTAPRTPGTSSMPARPYTGSAAKERRPPSRRRARPRVRRLGSARRTSVLYGQ